MINLLPDERKEEIRAARTNVILARYTTLIALAIVFLLGILFISHSILQSTKASADAIVEANDIKADVYSETKAQVDALSSKLSESKVLLDQEVRYSRVLTTLGQLMTPGTVLDSLTLDEAGFNGTPIDLKIYAKTDDDAATIRDRLQASPLFLQVNLKGTDSSGGITGYPVVVTISVLFNRVGIQ